VLKEVADHQRLSRSLHLKTTAMWF